MIVIYEDIKHLVLCSRIPYFSADRLVAASKQAKLRVRNCDKFWKNKCVIYLCDYS